MNESGFNSILNFNIGLKLKLIGSGMLRRRKVLWNLYSIFFEWKFKIGYWSLRSSCLISVYSCLNTFLIRNKNFSLWMSLVSWAVIVCSSPNGFNIRNIRWVYFLAILTLEATSSEYCGIRFECFSNWVSFEVKWMSSFSENTWELSEFVTLSFDCFEVVTYD